MTSESGMTRSQQKGVALVLLGGLAGLGCVAIGLPSVGRDTAIAGVLAGGMLVILGGESDAE